jgi:hypothetical protein
MRSRRRATRSRWPARESRTASSVFSPPLAYTMLAFALGDSGSLESRRKRRGKESGCQERDEETCDQEPEGETGRKAGKEDGKVIGREERDGPHPFRSDIFMAASSREAEPPEDLGRFSSMIASSLTTLPSKGAPQTSTWDRWSRRAVAASMRTARSKPAAYACSPGATVRCARRSRRPIPNAISSAPGRPAAMSNSGRSRQGLEITQTDPAAGARDPRQALPHPRSAPLVCPSPAPPTARSSRARWR